MRFILTCLVLSFLFCGRVDGQVFVHEDQTFIVSGGPITDWAVLLSLDGSIREDMELLDYQKVELDKLIQSTALANTEAQKLLRNSDPSQQTPQQRMQAMEDQEALLKKIQKEFKVEAQKHLLPHQILQLKRRLVACQLEDFGISDLLSSYSPIGSVLKLSPEENEAIKAKAAKVGD